MKDTILTARRKKTELITMLVCFIAANLVNLYSIITYHTPAIEMVTSIFYVIVAAVALYIAWSLLRVLFYGIKASVTKRKRG